MTRFNKTSATRALKDAGFSDDAVQGIIREASDASRQARDSYEAETAFSQHISEALLTPF